LPNTYGPDARRTRGMSEKMVDTAMASDVVDLAHREVDRWILILGEDDDLVPAVLTAEATRVGCEGRVLLLRRRIEGPFLRLEGLLHDCR
jgi:hypothetical protein